jgi:hypothetical protein
MKAKALSGKSFTAAQEAFNNHDYNHALNVLLLIDPMLLTPAFVQLASTTLTGQRLNAWETSERVRAEMQSQQ